MKSIKQLIQKHKYNNELRALTSEQILELTSALNNPEQMNLALALMYLKQQGTLWALQEVKKNPASTEMMSYQDRKIKSLINSSRNGFKALLVALRGVSEDNMNLQKDNMNLQKDNMNLQKDNMKSLNSQLDSLQALLELMWELMSLEQKQQIKDLLDD